MFRSMFGNPIQIPTTFESRKAYFIMVFTRSNFPSPLFFLKKVGFPPSFFLLLIYPERIKFAVLSFWVEIHVSRLSLNLCLSLSHTYTHTHKEGAVRFTPSRLIPWRETTVQDKKDGSAR